MPAPRALPAKVPLSSSTASADCREAWDTRTDQGAGTAPGLETGAAFDGPTALGLAHLVFLGVALRFLFVVDVGRGANK